MTQPVLTVQPSTRGPQVVEGDNRRNAQLCCYRDKVISQPQPVMDVNHVGTDCLQMLANKQLGLRIIGVELLLAPHGGERTHIASDRYPLLVCGHKAWLLGLLIRAGQDKAAMTPLLQGMGKRPAVKLCAPNKLWGKSLHYLENAQFLLLCHRNPSSRTQAFCQ
jgi:hypothetical protein